VVVLDGLYRGNVTLYAGCDCKQEVAIKERGKNGSGDNDRITIDPGTMCGNTEGGISHRISLYIPVCLSSPAGGGDKSRNWRPKRRLSAAGPSSSTWSGFTGTEEKSDWLARQHARARARARVFSSLINDHRARWSRLLTIVSVAWCWQMLHRVGSIGSRWDNYFHKWYLPGDNWLAWSQPSTYPDWWRINSISTPCTSKRPSPATRSTRYLHISKPFMKEI